MADISELLPCPFCGERAVTNGDPLGKRIVRCGGDRGCAIDAVWVRESEWNRRAYLAQTVDEHASAWRVDLPDSQYLVDDINDAQAVDDMTNVIGATMTPLYEHASALVLPSGSSDKIVDDKAALTGTLAVAACPDADASATPEMDELIANLAESTTNLERQIFHYQGKGRQLERGRDRLQRENEKLRSWPAKKSASKLELLQHKFDAAVEEGVRLVGKNEELRRVQEEAAKDAAFEAMEKVKDAEIERMRHEANEWADVATSCLVWLHNIRDGYSKVDVAIDNTAKGIKLIRDAARAQQGKEEGR